MFKFQSVNKCQPSVRLLMLGSFAASAIFVFLLCFLFDPRWETNDDVGMSMAAHGYGIAAMGSPNLIFSNIIWGYLVRLIPTINGVLGYSIATLSVLIIVGTVIIYGLCRLGLGYIGTLSALALILVRPILFPQFTINAGLLMVAAIICWRLFARQNDKRALMVGCLLAFCSYLVRSQEFLLVLIVALPLLPWRSLLLNRAAKVALLTLVVAIAASTIINHQAYQGDEWKSFNELKPAPFTDFGAGEHLKQRTDILVRHGYSPNDIDLISSWFFVDPNIANPVQLNAMLKELGSLPAQKNAFKSAWLGVKTLWHPILIISTLSAFALALLRPSWCVMASWGISISAVFWLGLLGRPGILRVYIPLVCLLVIAPLLIGQVSNWRKHLTTGVILVAAVFNTSMVFSEAKTSQLAAEQIRQGLVGFPTHPVVAWGGGFPYEAAYPVLGASSSAMSFRLYSLGSVALAPFSVAFEEEKAGRGMINLLMAESGLSIIANEQRFRYLEIYCKEHLHGQLKELFSQKYGAITVSQRSCRVSK